MVMPNGPALPYPDPIMQIGNSHLAISRLARNSSISAWTDEKFSLAAWHFRVSPILTIGTGQGTNYTRQNGPALPYPDPIMRTGHMISVEQSNDR
ncbi:hypothetical protein QLX08_001625 [Tetragonisca angustula]|uniref:Uncharacterized protein n=1 Tax=Tetragonisca angustula TaxID=166442 RepID=A0AAW1AHE1_9HYME